MAILCSLASVTSALYGAFGWAFAPRFSLVVLISVLLAAMSIGLLAYAAWVVLRQRRSTDSVPLFVYVVPVVGAVLAAGPLLFTAMFLSPRAPSPTDAELRQDWGAHAEEIKVINDAMLRYWADGKFEAVVLYGWGGSFVEGRTSADGESGVRISSREEDERLRGLMNRAGIWKVSMSRAGAWYQADTGGLAPFFFRGYFFYDRKRFLGQSGAPSISAESQLKRIGSVTDFIRLSDHWYIFTATEEE